MLNTQKQWQIKYHRSLGFDEMFAGPDQVRSHYNGVHERLMSMSEAELNKRSVYAVASCETGSYFYPL